MQRTFLYLLLLLLIGGGAYYFVFNRNENAFPEDEAGFTIKDTADIGRIYLAGQGNMTITLDRTDSGWTVNKKYKALRGTLNSLLECLYKQEAKFPAPENAHNNIVKSMAGSGVKVEVYDRQGKVMRVFYVGSEAHNSSGSYMLIQGAEKPYLVHIPGVGGFLMPYYPIDFKLWRDRTVFNSTADEIKSVSVQYPEAPLNSFTVYQDGKISLQADAGVIGTRRLNEQRVKDFLGFFKNINCEGYLTGVPGMDTTLNSLPKKCIIDLVTKQGRQQHVELYWLPLNRTSKNTGVSSHEVKPGFDADRYYAVMNNFKDTAIVQEYNFGKIFRKAYEFYEPGAAVSTNNMN